MKNHLHFVSHFLKGCPQKPLTGYVKNYPFCSGKSIDDLKPFLPSCFINIITPFACTFYLLFLLFSQPVHGEEKGPVRLGMSTALTGPTSFIGIHMKNGVEAALAEATRNGGVKGKPLKLIARDDGYEPSRTAPNMHDLIQNENVEAVIGNVGTPTAVSAIPIAVNSNTLFFGAYTGAGILRKKPPERYVINYRASYTEEVTEMVDALIQHAGLSFDEIAFFTQRDAYGDAGFAGGIAALKAYGLKYEYAVPHGRYERNTLAVENGLADILFASPTAKAVIIVGTYAPAAAFIKLSEENGFHPYFLNVSFVGAEPLAAALGKKGDGVIITQVVPYFGCDVPVVKAYAKAMAEYNPLLEKSFSSLEGYIAARILILGLSCINGPIDRESIVEGLESLNDFDIGLGVSLKLSKNEHQACHKIWPTVIKNGVVAPFEWMELRKSP